MAPPRKNASTLHGILRRLHPDRFRTFDLVRPPLQQHGRALLRPRLPTGRTLGKLAALGGDLWSDFGVGKRRSGDVVAGGLVSICEEWESDSDDCADCCLSVDDLCGLYVEFSSPFFFFFFGERCVAFGWSWGSWYADADADGEILDALGIVVTSAASQTLGSALWQPYLLLRAIQKYQYVYLSTQETSLFFVPVRGTNC